MSQSPPNKPKPITTTLLHHWPLPQPDSEGDKNDRGHVLVIGGAPEMPGAVILAATAALRAGAGKLLVGTCRSIAQIVGATIPEARVLALPETRKGAIDPKCATEIIKQARGAQAILIGPGMQDEDSVSELVLAILPLLSQEILILDAAGLAAVSSNPQCLKPLKGRAILTPHSVEMSYMTGLGSEAIAKNPLKTALDAAKQFGATVALKGAETIIAAPDGTCYSNTTGNVGLATSGSGDTLAGIIAGLAARGAEPTQATAWGVFLHGSAGEHLAKRMGPLGFLARELLAEIPPIMAALTK